MSGAAPEAIGAPVQTLAEIDALIAEQLREVEISNRALASLQKTRAAAFKRACSEAVAEEAARKRPSEAPGETLVQCARRLAIEKHHDKERKEKQAFGAPLQAIGEPTRRAIYDCLVARVLDLVPHRETTWQVEVQSYFSIPASDTQIATILTDAGCNLAPFRNAFGLPQRNFETPHGTLKLTRLLALYNLLFETYSTPGLAMRATYCSGNMGTIVCDLV